MYSVNRIGNTFKMIVTLRHFLNDLSVMCIYNTILKTKRVVNITMASGTTIPTFAEVCICQFYCNLKCLQLAVPCTFIITSIFVHLQYDKYQRGNAASVLGTAGQMTPSEFF